MIKRTNCLVEKINKAIRKICQESILIDVEARNISFEIRFILHEPKHNTFK
jgi:hypothetical protein